MTSKRPRSHQVAIEGFVFRPRSLEIARGDTVVWVNNDPFEHSAVSPERSVDSGVLTKGAQFLFVARERGNYDYRCALHPVMEGKLVVR